MTRKEFDSMHSSDVTYARYLACYLPRVRPVKTKDTFIQAKPKKTRQGMGTHSKPNHGRKKRRGQGK